MATLVAPFDHQMPIRPISLEEYHWLIDHGFFNSDERVELIEGVMRQKCAKSPPHAACHTKLMELLYPALGDRALVRAVGAITIHSSNSEPEPDFMVVAHRENEYLDHQPYPAEVHLVVEIADLSLDYDRSVKGPLYAGAGIAEYWIANLVESKLEVYREPVTPAEGNPYYRQLVRLSRQDTVRLAHFPDSAFAVADLIPG